MGEQGAPNGMQGRPPSARARAPVTAHAGCNIGAGRTKAEDNFSGGVRVTAKGTAGPPEWEAAARQVFVRLPGLPETVFFQGTARKQVALSATRGVPMYDLKTCEHRHDDIKKAFACGVALARRLNGGGANAPAQDRKGLRVSRATSRPRARNRRRRQPRRD